MNLVIVGTGLAGYMLAKEWRKLDSATTLTMITADDGGFYSKPLLSTAFTQQKTPEQLLVNNAAEMAEELQANIYCNTTVNAIDLANNQLIIDQKSIEFSRLVLACGADVIRPNLSGDAVTEIYSVNNLMNYREFRNWIAKKKRLAILGSGLVGCEFANDLSNAGFEITVIAPEQYPLASCLPAVIGNLLQQALAKQRVHWQLGHMATAVNRFGEQYRVTLSNGNELLVDGVFSAVGLRPRIGLAKQAGITVNRGIVVNRWLTTNFPHIFALGDCAEVDGEVQMYVAPLLQCARSLAKILAGGQDPVHYPAMPVVLKTPALPLIFSAPPPDVIGQWHLDGEGDDLSALFHDQEGQLRGFALIGKKIRDKMPLAKQLPLVFA